MNLDADTCYRALAARDPRFDGLFFVGVQTTGIYCRPVCPARTPGRDRVVFFGHGAEAERQGFRACFRCRPELAPGRAAVDATSRLADAAWARVQEGFLNEGSVDELARELGVTGRHLRRVLRGTLGVSPVQLAQSRRLALAKQLLQDSGLPLTEIAFAAGFGSVRRFNAVFQRRFGRAPSDLRRAHGAEAGAGLTLRLDYRPPLDWDALLHFLAPRAIPGVEHVGGGAYARTVVLGRHRGWLVVRPDPDRPALRAEVSASLAPVALPLVGRLRGLFDLDAQPDQVDGALARDPLLRRLVRARPGVRIPGAFDGFETALRVVLGQQVSVKGASTLSGRLAAALGEPVETDRPELTHAMPGPERVASAAPEHLARAIGLPLARARALVTLARAVARRELCLDRHAPVGDTLAKLEALPGFGDWTAQVVTLRALGWPDAFPASDLGLRRRLGASSPRALIARAERWRPWRGYATIHLWLSER